MAIFSLLYAAFGYLALLGAILWGMLFVADGAMFPNMDAAGTAAPLEAACVDVGLLLLLALLHRSVSRGMLRHVAWRLIPRGLERSTQAWAAAIVLVVICAGWQPLPQVLWTAPGPLQWAFSALFYIAWTLILIGAFLASHLDLFEITAATDVAPSAVPNDAEHAQTIWKASFTDMLRQPLYWRNPHGGVGHDGDDRRAYAAGGSGHGVSAVRRSLVGAQDRGRARVAARFVIPGRARHALAHYPAPSEPVSETTA